MVVAVLSSDHHNIQWPPKNILLYYFYYIKKINYQYIISSEIPYLRNEHIKKTNKKSAENYHLH